MTLDEYRRANPARLRRHREARQLREREQGRFDRTLEELLMEDGVSPIILSIPGIYEILSEHYNNDVLQRMVERLFEDAKEGERER